MFNDTAPQSWKLMMTALLRSRPLKLLKLLNLESGSRQRSQQVLSNFPFRLSPGHGINPALDEKAGIGFNTFLHFAPKLSPARPGHTRRKGRLNGVKEQGTPDQDWRSKKLSQASSGSANLRPSRCRQLHRPRSPATGGGDEVLARGKSEEPVGQARHGGDFYQEVGPVRESGTLLEASATPICAGFLCMAPPRAGNDTKDASRVSGSTCPSSPPAPNAIRLPRRRRLDLT
ncbi:hypothetical protein QBC45DRAFT_431262 [Copromyces sp. CBS 386.78]|nr:hypothetical protein QBC45DRAFT_431262 [Copromyces sp. CBS 386.78]